MKKSSEAVVLITDGAYSGRINADAAAVSMVWSYIGELVNVDFSISVDQVV